MNNGMKKTFAKSALSSKRFKYGASAVVFTAVFVVFVLLVNLVLSFIDAKTGGLYVDMTSKKLYGITEATRNALEEVTLPVEIVFARPSDIISGNDYSNQVRLLAENYESEFDNVSVIYRDVLTEPGYFNTFKTTSADVVGDTSIIVYCPSTGLSVIYDLSDMYKYSSSTGAVFAFDGENKLTSAILRVARDDDSMLRAGFVIGHNENGSDSLKRFLEDYGYEVSNVDLKTVNKSELSKYNILFVIDPQTDFIGRDTEMSNEIELLRDYVKEDFGNIMFFMNANSKELSELNELMQESFGVSVNSRTLIAEAATHQSNYLGIGNGLEFYGEFSDSNAGAGYMLHKNISEGEGVYPYFAYSPSLEIVKAESGNMTVTPVIVTSKNAVLSDGEGVVEWGSKPLMTLTEFTRIVDNNEVSAHVLVCGTTGFLLGLDVPSFANADLLKSALITMGNSNIVADIDFKVLDESEITVTGAVQTGMMKKLGITVPVIIAIVGIAVFIKRKYL